MGEVAQNDRVLQLVIPRVTPSLNKLLRLHWTTRRALQRDWGWEVAFAKRKAGVFGWPRYERCTVEIERRAPRLLDHDNAVGGLKVLLDALVANGLIEDDRPEVIGAPLVTQATGSAQTTVRLIVPVGR